jgi:ABC-type multidrug transport system ATPase subunit
LTDLPAALSNVLTCETPPTEGDINVFGYSVKNESDAIQQMVGVCKQDDYLWPCLTAKEHLDVFAGLRGVHADHHAQTVQKWLQSVDLETFQMQFTSEFSGGMKRRLSLALATIGGRPLIVLDEPTTGKHFPINCFLNCSKCKFKPFSNSFSGMDPLSRRFVWKHIDEIKQNRVVLLTTHAMEEADLLADTVAIMRRGELAALGTPLELKAAHGSELQFSILVPKEDTMTAAVFIRSHFEAVSKWITIIANETGNINVTILKIAKRVGGDGVGFDALSQFVAWLNDPKSNVLEYGFSNCSLEEGTHPCAMLLRPSLYLDSLIFHIW